MPEINTNTASPHFKRKYRNDEYYWVYLPNDGWYVAFYAGEKLGFEICGLKGYHQPEAFELISDKPLTPPIKIK